MTRHAEHVMGTVFSVDVRDPGDWTDAVGEVVRWLHWVDATFSTYRPDSQVSRLGRGEIAPTDCAPQVAEVLATCEEVAAATGGFFTARPGGRLDPSGVVKGWAIERASDLLTRAGARSHAVNGGGDMQLVGGTGPGRPWRVGIAHPLRPGTVVTVVAGRDLAVATSGTAERGAHIVNPQVGRASAGLAGITLLGERIGRVDAYATAAFAMGQAAHRWVEQLDGYEAFAVTASGGCWWTTGFPALGLVSA
jgi:FAD:protein FMN transferase